MKKAVKGQSTRQKRTRTKAEAQAKLDFGAAIRAARGKIHLSQQELADRVGIARNSLSKWEAGLRTPDSDKLPALCRILAALPETLLGIDGFHAGLQRRLRNLFRADGTDPLAHVLGFDTIQVRDIDPKLIELTVEHQEIVNRAVNGAILKAISEGRLDVPVDAVEAIAKVYSVPLNWLLTGDESHWTPALDKSWSSRVRYWRICIGLSSALAPGISLLETSEPYASDLAARRSLHSTLVAMNAAGEGGLDYAAFPHTPDWFHIAG